MSAPVMYRDAVFSPDGSYRYTLVRSWSQAPRDVWIMLNPSTADADLDDPTIRRCIGFSRGWGAGALIVVNLFALRSTNPEELLRHPDPIGPLNDDVLRATIAASPGGNVIAAWGAHRMAPERARAVARLVGPMQCLGTTRSGHPRHPLYVPAATALSLWTPR